MNTTVQKNPETKTESVVEKIYNEVGSIVGFDNISLPLISYIRTLVLSDIMAKERKKDIDFAFRLNEYLLNDNK